MSDEELEVGQRYIVTLNGVMEYGRLVLDELYPAEFSAKCVLLSDCPGQDFCYVMLCGHTLAVRKSCLSSDVTKRPLKSLEEFNREAAERHAKKQGDNRNGIACPQCGKELGDSSPRLELTTYPPKKEVHCEACGWKGYRIS